MDADKIKIVVTCDPASPDGDRSEYICDLPAGAKLADVKFLGILIADPDHPSARLIRPDGSVEELKAADLPEGFWDDRPVRET